MADITLSKKNISYNHHPVAADSKGNKTYFCYATLASCQKQLEKILVKGELPRTAEITGKDGMALKVCTYQDDGFWFESKIKDGKCWRLWTPFHNQEKLKKIVKKSKV